MNAFFSRLGSCALGLLIGRLIVGANITVLEWLLCTALITLFYVLLKPLLQALALPLNMFLFNLAQVFADGLLVWWASAWTPGLAMGYLEAVLIAALIALCHMPYALYKRKKLTKNIISGGM